MSITALLGALAVTYFAYRASRHAIERMAFETNLALARLLAESGSDPRLEAGADDALHELIRVWSQSSPPFPHAYLCVIGSDGRLRLNTRRPDLVGADVSSVELVRGEPGEARRVSDLLRQQSTWVGVNVSYAGSRQVVAYAYSPRLDGLVAVHVPYHDVEALVRQSTLPWLAGLGVILGVLLPLLLLLVHRLHEAARREIEEAHTRLEEREAHYRNLVWDVLERTGMGTAIVDAKGRVAWVNQAAERFLGVPRDAMEGQDFREVCRRYAEQVFQDPEAVLTMLEQAPRAGEAFGPEEVEIKPSGDRAGRWIEVRGEPIRSGAFEGGMVFYLTDVTERHRYEEELLHSASLHRATVESTQDGILVVDTLGRIVSYNEQFTRLWRIPQEILDSRDDERALSYVLSQLKDPEEFLAKVRALYENPEAESEDVLEFKDGRVFERYSRPQKIGGRTVGRVWSFRDVTEKRQLQRSLLQSQKLEAVGRLAGGIAHDFNNLLTAVVGYCDVLFRLLPAGHEARRQVAQIAAAAERATGLTRQLLAFSRRQVLRPEVLSLNQIVEEMADLLRRTLGEDVRLVLRLDPALHPVKVDRVQMEQVLLNLAVNAKDAMPEGGTLTLETANVELDEAYAERHEGVRPGDYVLLAVSDTGHGMDRETQARIFEPFFTTKDEERGTGLGLSTVYGIVKQSGGNIWVYSEEGKGTIFKLYLPWTHEVPEGAVRAPAASGRVLTGTETVLLAEDDEAVRLLTTQALEQAGYTVLAAADVDEAIQLARQGERPPDVLVTDVVMPSGRGPDLAEALRKSFPQLRVLLMSGYTDQALMANGLMRDPFAAFLQKPFRMRELLSRIRELLDLDPAP